MNRDDILRIAEQHSDLTAGWIFSAVGIERFWRAAYDAGAAAERKECAGIARDHNAFAVESRILARSDQLFSDWD